MNRREFLTEVGKVVVVLPAGFAWVGCTKKTANNADLTGGVGAVGVGGASGPVVGPATGGTSSIQPPHPQTGTAGRPTLDAASLLGIPDSGTAGSAGMGTSGAGGMGSAGMAGMHGVGGAAGMGTAGMGTAGMGGAGGTGGMTGTGGSTGGALTFTSSVTNSHTHDFSIQMSAIASPPSAGVSGMTTLNSGHTHMVMITMAQLAMIMAGMTVMVTTTGGTHTHTFSFHK